MDAIHDRGYWLFIDEINRHTCDLPLCNAIIRMFKDKKTAIDIGCGDGQYTKNLISAGIDCIGFDGSPLTPELSQGLCKIKDFSEPVDVGKFDLVLSLEVGEHIPAIYEQIFIDNICRAAKYKICMSWAIEGQSGNGHVNCRNNDYIIEQMLRRGFLFDERASLELRKESTLPWFRNTTMVFYKNEPQDIKKIFSGYENNLVSVVLTSCGRVDLLKNTVETFNKFNTFPIHEFIIVEDSGNRAVHRELQSLYPNYTLILNKQNIGLVKSIDRAYSAVTTPFIFHCFKRSTYIETNNGAKLIKDIQIGDMVKTHTGLFKPVTAIYKHHLQENRPLVWLKTTNSLIKTTPKHPFLMIRNDKEEWIQAKDISLTDYFTYPITIEENYLEFNCKDRWNKFDKIKVDSDFAKFMGLYLAEGWADGESLRFCFNNNEKDLQTFIIDFCKRVFKRKTGINISWATVIILHMRCLTKLFRNWFGKNAKEKRIPSFVFNWNLINKLNFIYGYILGDGYLGSGGSAVVVSASLLLIKDFIKLCNDCGIAVSEIDFRKPSISTYKGNKINGSYSYAVRLHKNCWNKLRDILTSEIKKNYCLIPVKAIILKKQSGSNKGVTDTNIYNLKVKDDNSFIANSVIAHNCENDWEFTRSGFIEKSLDILLVHPKIMIVWIRALNDTNGHPMDKEIYHAGDTSFFLLSTNAGGGSWHGFTWNPGLRRLSDYKLIEPFDSISPLSKAGEAEMLIGIMYHKMAFRAAILPEGYVFHTGSGRKDYSLV